MNNNQRKVGTMLAKVCESPPSVRRCRFCFYGSRRPPARPQDFLEHTLYLRKEHVRAILLRFSDPSEYHPSNARGADYQAN